MSLLDVSAQTLELFAHIGTRRKKRNFLRNAFVSRRGLVEQIVELRVKPFADCRWLGGGYTRRVFGQPADLVCCTRKHIRQFQTFGSPRTRKRVESEREGFQNRSVTRGPRRLIAAETVVLNDYPFKSEQAVDARRRKARLA